MRTQHGNSNSAMVEALTNVRRLITQLRFPLPVSESAGAATDAAVLAAQLNDLLDDRQRAAPVLRTVVTGPTGSGKSTVINTVVGANLSPSGVLRPTTRQPIVVCHPEQTQQLAGAWLPSSVRIVTSAELAKDAVFVDVPDVDSVVRTAATHPEDLGIGDTSATQTLLAAADQWLFLTTAARYADAVPWRALHQARTAGTALAIVLNRVPAAAADEIRDHMVTQLTEHGLDNVPLFVICEEKVTDGQLSAEALVGVRGWLEATAAANTEQHAALETTDQLRPATELLLSGVWPRLNALADEMENQLASAKQLSASARAAFALSLTRVRADLESGSALRGDALARWRDFVGAGDLLRALESRSGHWASLWSSWAEAGASARCEAVSQALSESLTALLTATVSQASDDAFASWRDTEAGRHIIDSTDGALALPAAVLRREVHSLIHGWLERVSELVRTEQVSRRTAARLSEYGRAATATVVSVAALTPPSVVDGDAELLAGDRAAAVVVSDHVVRRLASKARAELLAGCQLLIEQAEQRFAAALAESLDAGAHAELPAKLRAAAILVESARKQAFDLTAVAEITAVTELEKAH